MSINVYNCLSSFLSFFLLDYISICFPRYLAHAVLHLHSTHSPQQSHPSTTRGLCLSAAYSPLCHFRVVSMRCRNVQISSFGPQRIRQDYPQAACGLSPCLSVSSATAHQADRSTAHLTPAAFPGFSSVLHLTKQAVNQKACLLLSNVK